MVYGPHGPRFAMPDHEARAHYSVPSPKQTAWEEDLHRQMPYVHVGQVQRGISISLECC